MATHGNACMWTQINLHKIYGLSPSRYVYTCARGCVRFSLHARIQSRQDLFTLNRQIVRLIGMIHPIHLFYINVYRETFSFSFKID